MQIAVQRSDRPSMYRLIFAASCLVGRERAIDLVRIGLYARDAGLMDVAQALFVKLMRFEPNSSFAYYEAATTCLITGRHEEGVSYLRLMVSRWPHEHRAKRLLAHLLFLEGYYVDACRILADHPPNADAQEAQALREFGDYLRALPRYEAHAIRRRVHNLSPDNVLARIVAARQHGIGFALIRLGDGEGTFFGFGTEDERAYRTLYLRNRSQFFDNWFGEALHRSDQSFLTRAGRLRLDLADADIIGVPHREWVDHEYRIGSLRGIVGVGNVLRAILRLTDTKPNAVMTCEQLVHLQLHNIGGYDRLLRGEREVGLIACYEELPAVLIQRFDVAHVEFHRTPGPKSLRAVIGDEAAEGDYFPERFNQIMAAVARPHRGRLFLIAGGLLSKVVAMEIKRWGGVAIDIGSMADIWMGKATRPGYAEIIANNHYRQC